MVALYEQFILFGDSITQYSADQEGGFGFTPALQNAYMRKLDVINRGMSGYNTDHALRVLPAIIPSPKEAKVKFITIFFGANDACSLDAKNGQHVPLPQYQDNLTEILTHPAIKAHNPHIILITPGPVNEHQRWAKDQGKGWNKLMRTNKVTRQYAEAAKEVAKDEELEDLDIAVLDLWSAFMEKAGWKEGQPLLGSADVPESPVLKSLLNDGLHFTADGYRVLFDEVMKVIRAKWPKDAPENLHFVTPPWDSDNRWHNWKA